VGRALLLNGSTGVRLPDNLIRDRSYSISMWLNPTVATQFTTAFFGWATDSSWISLVPRGPGGAQHTMLWSGTQWFDGTFNSAIPIGAWSHLVMVVNNGTLNLYLNGALVNTMANFPDVFTPAPATQFALGVNFWDTPYNGLVESSLVRQPLPSKTQQLGRSDPALGQLQTPGAAGARKARNTTPKLNRAVTPYERGARDSHRTYRSAASRRTPPAVLLAVRFCAQASSVQRCPARRTRACVLA
jgi:hypothetical protein